MKIEQIYTGCLAQGAYYIESKGEAVIIDPLRETESYLRRAEKDDAKIKYIFETHFHADFVSGHVTLAKQTGASIVYGPNAETSFKSIIAEDGQSFSIGELQLIALHTPGHTIESTTYLLKDKNGTDYAIFSGDTLFLGDVGRPDLAQKSANMTQDQLAGLLYDSLRTKIMPLADHVIVYPAHGAGSACGKNLSKETVGTIGEQKQTNYALRHDMTKVEFIKEVTDNLPPPPEYFPQNVKLNKEGYEDFDKILKRGFQGFSPENFEQEAEKTGAIILDTRSQVDFAKGHIPKSIFIGLDGGFAPWVGSLIGDVMYPILLIASEGREEEAITRLSRVGFDNTLGFLGGGFKSWTDANKDIDTIASINAIVLEENMRETSSIFDVRKPSEYNSEHIQKAINTPLDFISDHLDKFPKDKDFYIHCAGGYRSIIASSILKSRGIHNMVNIEGGFQTIKQTKIPITK